MFAIAWQYLTGRAVATHPANRQEPEWPPHPDRIFQAMVAGWGSLTDEHGAESLNWLASQGSPWLHAAEPQQGDTPKVYVPVNDLEGTRGVYGDKLLGLLPTHRTRKERYFPSVVPESALCVLTWPKATPTPQQRVSLARICTSVTHIGHSRSLVRMWITDEPPPATWLPASPGMTPELHLRVPDPDRLATLRTAFVQATKHCAANPDAPVPLPPRAPWVGYVRSTESTIPHGLFSAQWIVLRRTGGDRLYLEQTLGICQALRDALISHASPDILELVSGHPSGSPDPLERPHLAVIPLADVGHAHAEGRLLGLALVPPVNISGDQREGLWQALSGLTDPETSTIHLVAGHQGALDLQPEDRVVPPLTLRPGRWCQSSAVWATVTPIVLDRLPPRRHTHDEAWAVEQVRTAVWRQGLPDPAEVCLVGASVFLGAPISRTMPPFVRKDGTRRWHLHATIRFAGPVQGPVLVGAGRYRGYGLCAPWNS